MGNLESIGDAVTGSMIGRAVEPVAGEADGHSTEANCLNCGAPLAGAYCAECGQRAHLHRTLSAFFHDLVHGVLHFDGKIWRTLPLLAWRPGELTRRYIDGQRARFVSPIALFLFCVFMLFAVGGLTGNTMLGGEAAGQMQSDLRKEAAQNSAKVAALEAERAAAIKAGRPTKRIDDKLADLRGDRAALSVLNGDKVTAPVVIDQDDDLPPWLQVPIEKARKNPELLLYKLKTNAYKFSWALIPISVPFVWLLFPFSRRFRLYDHVVFVTYSLCFMSLLAITAMLFGWVGLSVIAGLLVLVPPFHMYRQLKGAYGLSRFGALWRASLLTVFAFIAAGLFVSLVAGVGIAD